MFAAMSVFRAFFCTFFLIVASVSLSFAGADIDPFELKFKREASSAPKKVPGKAKDVGDLESRGLAKVISFKATLTPAKAKRGEIIKLTLTGIPAKGYHTYPITQRTEDMGDGQLGKVTFPDADFITPLYPIREPVPVPYKSGKSSYVVHKAPFAWEQDLFIELDAPAGKHSITVRPWLMVCDNRQCVGPGYYPDLEVTLDIEDASVAPPANLAERANKPSISVVNADALTKASGLGGGRPTTGTGQGPPMDLWGLVVAAFVGGLLMVFTPCVFPMIPITVNFFIKQSEKEHHRPLFMAGIYSGTIIFLLTLTVVLFGEVVVRLAENPWFNLALGGILIFFALSLFGMYEIELPSFLARFTSSREGKGGVAGAFFMALTFTITSFTCTGPFLGVMLAPFAEIKPPFENRLLAALVYSTTFAAPFFFLALFPTMLRKLPKSGGWMNSIKVTMGFLELGAALKFLANSDYGLFPGRPRIFTYDAVLCAWIAISFAAGLYLLGVFRLPHDDPQDHVGVVRMVFGTIFFGLTLYMLPLLFGGRPTGIVGEGLQAFLPPRLGNSPGGLAFGGVGNKKTEHLSWHRDYADAWKEAIEENKLLLIDFTGVYCTNCRANEENVFPLPAVAEEMKKYVRVQLYTDTLTDTRYSASEAVEIAQKHKRWRNNLVKDVTLPYYVILRPDPEKPFDGDEILGEVIDTRKDLIRDENDFVQFLRRPVKDTAIAWSTDYFDAWQKAKREKKQVLISFTSVFSTDCRDVEASVIPSPEVQAALKSYVPVLLYFDMVADPMLSREAARSVAQRNGEWLESLGDPGSGHPFFAVIEPNGDAPLEKDGLNGQVVGTRYVREAGDLVDFLRAPAMVSERAE